MEALTVRLSRLDGTVTMTVRGDLDMATVALLRRRADHLLLRRDGDRPRIVIELSGLTFIDATGLGALIALRGRTARGRPALTVAGRPPCLTRLLNALGMADDW
ncbi:STAS domain-containing protein [Actinomadura hibisca]|uniref:STAS domain-containing protein n=1 Tax=Actinomadura hibisca TaxID=68565 RepID=UPI000831B898|nr:STAS domain-containing protein [Actinomadura hibisca]